MNADTFFPFLENKESLLPMLVQAVQQSASTVVITDLNGTIQYVNPKFVQLTGYSAAEVIGKNARILKSGKTPPNVYRDMWATITNGQEWRGEVQNKKKNGELYWGSLTISPIKTPDNVVTQYLGIEEDITQQKMLELKLQSNNAELKRSNAELEGFTRVVAHDLMGPIGNVISCLKMATEDPRSSNSIGTDGMLRLALRSADKAAQLIRDLLDYSKVGGQVTAMAEVDMNEVLAEVLESLRPQIEGSSAQICIDELPTLYCSKLLMEQLFQNLIANAMNYRSKFAPIIKVTAKEQEQVWVFAVEDNGVGISADELPNVFEPFYRIASTSDRPGTGIGLATSEKIVKAHGGKIWAESEAGKGTTFSFTLPRYPLEGEAPLHGLRGAA
jgi:PAS domain S-box-containing protein